MPQMDPAWAVAVLLLWARLATLLTLSPLAQAVKAPAAFWVLFTLALSSGLCAALGLRTNVPTDWLGLVIPLLGEVAFGALLGLALHMAFGALAMAGRLLDLQMGMGMAAVLDPVTRAQMPVMGVALNLLGLAVFWGVQGHHALLRGLAAAAQWVPPGSAWPLPQPAALARAMGATFSLGIAVVAPAIFLLLLTDWVLSFSSRVLPQMNVMFIGMPVKALVGLSALAIASPGLEPAFRRLYASVFDLWASVLP